MAKLKLQTSKKKINKRKEELKAPDEVTTHLQKLSEHLNTHFKLYLAGLGGLIVLTLAVTWVFDYVGGKAIARSNALTDASSVVLSPVAEHGDEKVSLGGPGAETEEKVEPAFKTEAERWAAAAEKTKAAVESTDGELKALATALDGRVKLALGQPGDAGKAFAAFAEELPDNSLIPLVTENQGHAAAAEGNLSAASGFFEKLVGSDNLYYRVRGNVLLGDLYSPRVGKADGKDAGKAKEYYEAALDALKPGEGQVATESIRALRAEIKRRQALL